MNAMSPFHLAFPVSDIEATRNFYTQVLQCEVGREAERWIDFNFFGHQITAHLDATATVLPGLNPVDNKSIPSRHFGAVLPWEQWDGLVERLQRMEISFFIEPYTRFVGETGEQRTFFIQDPCENYLEFKCFRNPDRIFKAL